MVVVYYPSRPTPHEPPQDDPVVEAAEDIDVAEAAEDDTSLLHTPPHPVTISHAPLKFYSKGPGYQPWHG
jgi:hypothetical protein